MQKQRVQGQQLQTQRKVEGRSHAHACPEIEDDPCQKKFSEEQLLMAIEQAHGVTLFLSDTVLTYVCRTSCLYEFQLIL